MSALTLNLFLMNFLLQTQGDPDWERFFSWLEGNWFRGLIILLGVIVFILLARWIASKIERLGVFATGLLIFFTFLFLLALVWIIGFFTPRAIGFGPNTWNQSMAAAGNQPGLIVPGDPLPPGPNPPGPNPTATPVPGYPAPPTVEEPLPNGTYEVYRDAFMRSRPDGDSDLIITIPDGGDILIVDTHEGDGHCEFNDVWQMQMCRRYLVEYDGRQGYIHGSTVGERK